MNVSLIFVKIFNLQESILNQMDEEINFKDIMTKDGNLIDDKLE